MNRVLWNRQSSLEEFLVQSLPAARPAALASRTEGRLLTLEQRGQLKGSHPRQAGPSQGCEYVAGVALSNEERCGLTATIAEVQRTGPGPSRLCIVQHHRWQGPRDASLLRVRALLGEVWGCRLAAIGEMDVEGRVLFTRRPLIAKAGMGGESRTAPHRMADLVRAITLGRIKMYAEDSSTDCQDFWAQIIRARREGLGANLKAYVEPFGSDDGFLGSLSLLAEAVSHLDDYGESSSVQRQFAA